MLRSFRLKLSLLAAATSGLMILGFGLTVWSFVEHAGQAHLDREVRAVAMHCLEYGPRQLEEGSVFGEELNQIACRVVDAAKGEVYRSGGWPDTLPDEALPRLGTREPRCPRAHSPWGWDASTAPAAPAPQPHHGHSSHGHAAPDAPPPRLACPCAESTFADVVASDGVWRVGTFPDGPLTLYVAVDLRTFHDRAAHVTTVFVMVLLPTLLLAGAGGWWLAGRALRPVTALTEAAEGITASQLERRIPEEGADLEFARLTAVFNGMLERLQKSYQQAIRFSADVSHELNTPLTIMQGELETALGRVDEGGPAQLALGSQLEEVQRLKSMVKKLLLLARADAGTLQPQQAPIDLSECVTSACEDFQALAPELRFELAIGDGLRAVGDPSLVPLTVQNLLANATKYNQPAGHVRVELEATAGALSLSVSNTGPAIEGDERERVFDRFYRGDPARGRSAGAGLGLSLAREVARAHGGDLRLTASDSRETTFVLTLPAWQG